MPVRGGLSILHPLAEVWQQQSAAGQRGGADGAGGVVGWDDVALMELFSTNVTEGSKMCDDWCMATLCQEYSLRLCRGIPVSVLPRSEIEDILAVTMKRRHCRFACANLQKCWLSNFTDAQQPETVAGD